MSKKVVLGMLLIINLMINVTIVGAATTVSGTQSGTWLLINSPYIVTDTVTVESGNSLIVEPGVIVKFATGTSLISYGELIAVGTPNGTITFTSNKNIPQSGDWSNIRFSGNQSKGTLSYCLIQYAQQGIYLNNVSEIVITHNIITDNKGKNGVDGNGNAPQPGELGCGIYLSLSSNIFIGTNTISNNIGGKGGNSKGKLLENGGDGGIGVSIYLDHSGTNTIIGNTLKDNTGGEGGNSGDQGSGGNGGIGGGIYLLFSERNTIIGNTITTMVGGKGGNGAQNAPGGKGGISTGIYLSSSTKNIVISNNISENIGGVGGRGDLNTQGNGAPGNGYGIYIETNSYDNLVDPTNTWNSEPIHYYYGIVASTIIENQTLTLTGSGSTNLGRIIFINCQDFIINDNYITGGKGDNGETGNAQSPGEAGDIGCGIYLLSCNNGTISYNTIENNQGGMGGPSGWANSNSGKGGLGCGIYSTSSTRINILNNIIKDNIGGKGGMDVWYGDGPGGSGVGIYLSLSTDTTISSNTISENKGGTGGTGGKFSSGGPGGIGVGIYLDLSVNNIIRDYNIIINNSGGIGNPDGNGIGIYCKSSEVVELIYNNIYNNQTYNLQTDISPGTQTAEYNWWGYDPPATSIFSGNIDYIPWLKGPLPVSITVSPTSGTVGTIITIDGQGYLSTELIVIRFGTIPTIAMVTTNAAGTFLITFTFPLQVRGTKTVMANSLKTGFSAAGFFNVLCNTRLEIKPDSKIVTKGDEFVLDVWLKDVVNLAGLDVSINFNPNLLEVLDDMPGTPSVQITPGEFPPNKLVLYNVASNTLGYIDYSLGLVPATNTATGEGILARIRFKAKDKGTATISFAFDAQNNRWTVLKDGDNQPIPITTSGATVTIFEYGSLEGHVVIDPPKGTGSNAGILVTLVGVGATNTTVGGYYSFPEIIPGTYTLQADTFSVAPGTITEIRVYPGTKTTVATLTLLNGDSNNDGVVDIEDFIVLRNAYKSSQGQPNWNDEANYNGDTQINIDDFMILRMSFFKSQPAPPAPAPPAPAPHSKLPVKTAKTKLTFTPEVIDTYVGATFSVRVMLEDVEDLAACQMQLSFDANLLEVVNITTGTLTLPVIKSQFSPGRIDYACGLLEGKVSGSGVLAKIEFKVKNTGMTYIKFDFDPSKHRMTKMLNINSPNILFDVNEVKVNVKPISTLDHFEFDNITSPKADNIPFNVKIKALDVGNNLVDYNDSGTLTLHNISGTITPKVITFGSGTWQGTVTINGTGTNVFITIEGSGKVGTSNLFNLKVINVPKGSNDDIVIKSADEKAIVVIEKGSPNQDAYVEIKKVTIPNTPPPPNIPQDVTPVVIEVKVVTAPETKLEIKGSITLTYTDEEVKGLDESRLRIFYYNGSTWELASDRQEVDTVNNRIIAYNITHFSIYAIGSLVAPNLSNVQVYPNPFKPTTIHAGKYVTFKNLTSYWNLKIVNLAGELVDEKTGETNEAHWDGNNQAGNPCASGVYIYLIINDRNEKVTGRVVVIR
ncbi:MAG: cohesin domain-containing protein [bacterium]|nr:cohesin domain-containing protein [bacterium]